jgi:hypothetical protein
MTPRDPSRPTAGAFVAYLHGRPWTPYQRAIADLIGERTPTGRYAYPVCVIQLPRQVGKTAFAFDLALGRCLEHRDYQVAYTSQTGHATTERFNERMTELATTALAGRVRSRRSAGTERITLGAGSYLKAFPPKDGAAPTSPRTWPGTWRWPGPGNPAWRWSSTAPPRRTTRPTPTCGTGCTPAWPSG